MSGGTARAARAGGRLLRLGIRTAPLPMLASFGLASVRTVGATIFPFALKILLDGILARSSREIALGALLAALLSVLTWSATMLGANVGFLLTDRVSLGISVAVARAVAGAGGIAHLDSPAYQADLAAVERDKNDLAGAPQQLLVFGQVVLRLLIIAAVFGLVYPPLALLALGGLIPLGAEVIAARLRGAAEAGAAAGRRSASELTALLTTAGPAAEVRVYGLAAELTDRHAALAAADGRQTRRSALRCALVSGAGWLGFAAAFVLGAAVIVTRALRGQASPGDVLLTITLIQQTQVQMTQVTQLAGQLARGAASMAALDRLGVGGPAGQRAAEQQRAPGRLSTGIQLSSLRFRYPASDRDALAGIDLELPAGSVVALVGPNGSGKSTLVNLLLGMYEPSDGAVRVDGTDLRALDLAGWHDRTAAAFQDYARLELTAIQGVGIGDLPRIGDEPAVTAALARAGMPLPDPALPDGLATRLGQSLADSTELSAGQWQKMALGRGFMREDVLLLVLDEPSSALDPAAEAAFLASCREAARELGRRTSAVTVMITHRLSAVRDADLIVVLDGGRVREAGTHAELMSAGGRYAAMFSVQADGYR